MHHLLWCIRVCGAGPPGTIFHLLAPPLSGCSAGSDNQPEPGFCKRIETMDKDRIEGVANQVKGTIKEVIGKVTGDTKTEAEGKVEKTGGQVQEGAGKVKDKLRDALGE
jgi:uncharacterized protein YjbJ (UPF0337 family)